MLLQSLAFQDLRLLLLTAHDLLLLLLERIDFSLIQVQLGHGDPDRMLVEPHLG